MGTSFRSRTRFLLAAILMLTASQSAFAGGYFGFSYVDPGSGIGIHIGEGYGGYSYGVSYAPYARHSYGPYHGGYYAPRVVYPYYGYRVGYSGYYGGYYAPVRYYGGYRGGYSHYRSHGSSRYRGYSDHRGYRDGYYRGHSSHRSYGNDHYRGDYRRQGSDYRGDYRGQGDTQYRGQGSRQYRDGQRNSYRSYNRGHDRRNPGYQRAGYRDR